MSKNRNNERDVLLEATAASAITLLRQHDLDKSIPKVLQTIGTAAEADRMYFVEMDPISTSEAVCCRRQYSWCAPGIAPAMNAGSVEGRDAIADGFGNWMARLAKGEIVAGSVEDFEGPVRQFLEADGTVSFVCVPVFIDGVWWGHIGFDACKAKREWLSNEINALRTLAEVIGAAISHARITAQLSLANRIIEQSPSIVFRMSAIAPYKLNYISPNIARYGYQAEELLSSPSGWRYIVEPEDLDKVEKMFHSIANEKREEADAEFRLIMPDGSRIWFDGRITAYRAEDSRLIAIEGVMSDITERKLAARETERLARTDGLTGLANRSVFSDKITTACKADPSGEEDRLVAVYFIDLDGFKAVNDTLGHLAGDELLRLVAKRLTRSLRDCDVVARFGGDEFAILQANLPSLDIAQKIADRTCKLLGVPYMIGDQSVTIGASIGLECRKAGTAEPEEMLWCADLALYRAKEDGRNCVRLYDRTLDTSSSKSFESSMHARPAA